MSARHGKESDGVNAVVIAGIITVDIRGDA